jgi:hypothetical protein
MYSALNCRFCRVIQLLMFKFKVDLLNAEINQHVLLIGPEYK